MRRRRAPQSLAQVIAAAVRKALASREPATRRRGRRAIARRGPVRRSAPSTPREDEPRKPPALTASAAPAVDRAGADLIDSVRQQLGLSFEGRPVAPSRIAALLKLDVTLVEATLGYLVSRKEAKAVWTSGRPGYAPVRTSRP